MKKLAKKLWRFLRSPGFNHVLVLVVFGWIATDSHSWHVTRILALFIFVDEMVRPCK